MKKTVIAFATIFTFILALCVSSYGQNQIANLEGINYQAVAIDEDGKEIVGTDIDGKPLYEKEIGVRFTIDNGPSGSTTYYQDEHTTNTDMYGLFSLTIGLGTNTGAGTYDSLLNIPWINGDQWLKVEISIENDGSYREVGHERLMAVPYSFYTDDIADNSITTYKIVDETIQAEDIDTGAVTTSEILNETILAEDIGTGSVETSEILNETILAEDIGTGSVETSEILNETILAEDIGTGSVETSEILNETILAEDIDTGAVTTSEILNGTILNEDISNGTIDLTSKVANILPVPNGGTGVASSTDGGLLIGGGASPIRALPQGTDGQIVVGVTASDPVMKELAAGPGIGITLTSDSVIITSSITGGVNSNGTQSINIGTIATGTTYTSPAFPVPGGGSGVMGDIVLASLDVSLQGCMLTPYFFSSNTIKIAIFNGTGSPVNLGNGVIAKVLVVQ